MEIIDNTENREYRRTKLRENTKLVNRLVRQSFGIGFRGDYEYESAIVPGSGSSMFKGNERARYISRNFLPFLGIFGAGIFEDAGHFNEADGSKIVVKPKYKEVAIKYAHLYKQKTGKEVQITII